MPCEFLDACLIVLLNIVHILVLVVGKHDALHDRVSILYLAELLLYISTNVSKESVLSIHSELLLQVSLNLFLEFLLALYITLAKGLVEEFLVDSMLYVASDFCNLV